MEKTEKVINLIDKPLNSAPIVIPEGYGITEVNGEKKLRKRIGTRTERKVHEQSAYSVSIHTEVDEYEDGRKVEKQRVSRVLKNKKADYYITSHDHAKKVKGDSKGSIKAKFQRQTHNALEIIKKASSDTLNVLLAKAYEAYTLKEMPLRNFESKIKNSWKFRLEVLENTGYDFEKIFGTPEHLRKYKKKK